MRFVLLVIAVCALTVTAWIGFGGSTAESVNRLLPDPVATMLNPESNPVFETAYHNLSYSPDGKWLGIGQGTGNVLLWETEGWDLKQTISAHDNWAFSVIFSSQSDTIYTGGGDDLIKVWDLDSPDQPVLTLSEHGMDVHALALNREETVLVSAGDDMIPVIWNLQSGKVIKTLLQHPKQVTSVAISPNGKYVATGSRDSVVRLFLLDTGELEFELDQHEKDVMSIRFSPDGELLASASYDGTICIWDVDMGYLVEQRANHEGAAVCVDFSPGGEEIVSVDHEKLTFLETADLKTQAVELRPELQEGEQLSFVRYHPLGKQLAVSTTAARVLIVDAASKTVTHAVSSPELSSADPDLSESGESVKDK